MTTEHDRRRAEELADRIVSLGIGKRVLVSVGTRRKDAKIGVVTLAAYPVPPTLMHYYLDGLLIGGATEFIRSADVIEKLIALCDVPRRGRLEEVVSASRIIDLRRHIILCGDEAVMAMPAHTMQPEDFACYYCGHIPVRVYVPLGFRLDERCREVIRGYDGLVLPLSAAKVFDV